MSFSFMAQQGFGGDQPSTQQQPQQQQQQQQQQKHGEDPPALAFAWDPRCPATLRIPSSSDPKNATMNSCLSHDGVGCNAYETSALMELLDARDAYLKSDVGSGPALRSLSTAYRKALMNCTLEWEDARMSAESSNPPEEELEDNLELLKMAHAVTQLAESFLIVPSSSSSSEEVYGTTTSHLPGAVTADTVRYLRLHHMSENASSFLEEETLHRLQTSRQPEQVDGGELFWELVESFVKRGCLEDAWAWLSSHSMFRRCMEMLDDENNNSDFDEYLLATAADDREGFLSLRAILLCAPLPGGRTDEKDAKLDAFMENSDNPNSTSDVMVISRAEEEEELLDGIPRSAYKLWETNSNQASYYNSNNRGLGLGYDYPIHFQPQLAMQLYRSWKQTIMALPAVQRLKRRIPQLDRILHLLTGNFSNVKFDSWPEALCAELLYKIPNLKLVDMHVRATRIMEEFQTPTKGSFEEVILSVMKGNAGQVIVAMHELGGGSGAALPATMTSMLCNLLDDAELLPNLAPDNFSLKTELLLEAALAIRSSLATEGHHYLATRLTVRLLVPHIRVGGDLRITAHLVDTLEHHFPDTDAEANALLALCRKFVERKNVRVLDGCVSICLARYRYFLSDERPGGAIHWLLTGMELESLVLCGKDEGTHAKRTGSWQRSLSTGVCFRLLVTSCLETSQTLLKGMLGEGQGVSLMYAKGKEMVTALEESNMAGFVPAVKVLEHVVVMAEAIAERKDDSIAASSIVACLEERVNDEDDGVVSCLARSSMHWDLLRLAKGILDRSVQQDGGVLQEKMNLYVAAFDVRGMQVLLERFTIITASREMEQLKPISAEETYQIRLALGEGLMRAFVAENSMKNVATHRVPQVSVAGIVAADLGKHSREKQELVVQKMLDL